MSGASLTRDKADTLLLLLAALMVLAPHLPHLPAWISALACAALLWRAVLTWRGRRLPSAWLLVPVALAAMAGVQLSYRSLLGRDADVAMLVLLLTFKLLEMRARRDLFVVTFLSLFVLLTSFLYAQSIPAALWAGAAVAVLLTAQQSFQYTGAVPPLRRRLLTTARLAALAAPLALLLFIAFPRVQGPLWGQAGAVPGGTTGISDSMAPGTLARLAQSDEIAFRVRFDGAAPAQHQLYWRSVVLGDYDGHSWTRVPRKRGLERLTVQVRTRGPALRYATTLEPANTRWLALLELSGATLSLPGYRVRDSDELEQFATEPITRRVRFAASAWPSYTLQAGEQPQHMTRWLALPDGFNPRTLALARQLRAAQPDADARQLNQTLLARFRAQDYRYTLAPPLAGRDAVDDFLFDSRAGFCEHYASAYVVLMRALGVPARVVTGYQGGERNPLDGVLSVRQSDAHAWAEFWTARDGWQRVDPTAAVAPERVQRGLARALPRPAPFGLGPLIALQNDPASWLAQLRYGYAALNNSWNQWVLDYNPDRQRNFLGELESAAGHWREALAVALGCALCGALLWRRWRRAPAEVLDGLYAAFCRQQARHGYARGAAEGPRRYAARLRTMPATPRKHAAMAQFLQLYGMLKYAAVPPESRPASLATLKTLLPLCR
ncbi:transglutaminase family protein [Duganella lactea]